MPRKKGEGRFWGKGGAGCLLSASNKVKVRGPWGGLLMDWVRVFLFFKLGKFPPEIKQKDEDKKFHFPKYIKKLILELESSIS